MQQVITPARHVTDGMVEARPGQLSLLKLVVLFLAPGAAGVLAYIAVAGVIQAAGYPPIAALTVAFIGAILPIEIAVLLFARSHARAAGEPLIPYRQAMRWRSWAWLVPALVAAALVAKVLMSPVDARIAGGVFGWLPSWFGQSVDPSRVGQYSVTAWVVTLSVYTVVNGFVTPIVEEIYFRGWLLPRMERFGRWAPLLNVTLFSVYHFWLPSQVLSRIAAIAPWAYAVRWRRNVYVGMAVHIFLNTVFGCALAVATVAGHL
jgi:uncharacterized protein